MNENRVKNIISQAAYINLNKSKLPECMYVSVLLLLFGI